MKQLLFLLLFPCLALAQYSGNAGQKITLGEQTTADGLVYRGLAADTTRKPSVDTMAYILLDTNTNIIWQYKKATNNAWTRLNLLPSDTTSFNYVNTYGTQTVNGEKTFTSSLRVPNIGVGRNTDVVSNYGSISLDGNTGSFIRMYANNIETFRITNDATVTQFAGIGRGFRFDADPQTYALNILSDGKTGFSVVTPTENIDIAGNARIRGLANAANPVNVQVDVNGVLVRTSSIDIKEDVQSLPYGLNEVMLLQPSKFSYIDKYKYGEGYDIGFIAEDVNNVIPEAVGTGVESDVFMDSVKLIPVLTKAIQEQNTLIKALEKRILTLENK
jgi:hypothetical protein